MDNYMLSTWVACIFFISWIRGMFFSGPVIILVVVVRKLLFRTTVI